MFDIEIWFGRFHRRHRHHQHDAREVTIIMAWNIGSTGTFSAVADDASGNVLSLPISYAVDDATVLGLTDNGDGTASVTALAAGAANLVATAANPDGTTTASAPFAITVNAPDAASVTVTETSGPDVTA